MLHIDKSVFCALHTLTTLVTCLGHISLPHWLHVWGTYPHHTGYMFGAPLHFTHLCLHTPPIISTYFFLLTPFCTYETHMYGMVEVKKYAERVEGVCKHKCVK